MTVRLDLKSICLAFVSQHGFIQSKKINGPKPMIHNTHQTQHAKVNTQSNEKTAQHQGLDQCSNESDESRFSVNLKSIFKIRKSFQQNKEQKKT